MQSLSLTIQKHLFMMMWLKAPPIHSENSFFKSPYTIYGT